MKMANYSNQSAVMLALLSLLLIPVFAVEQTIYENENGDCSKILKQLVGKKELETYEVDVKNIITTAIAKDDREAIKDILEVCSGFKNFAFMLAFQKENIEMLKNIIDLQNPPKPVGFDTLSNCLKLAINFQKKHLLNFLSDKHNLNIDQDGVDALFLAILDSVDCEENVFRGSWEGSWGELSEELSDHFTASSSHDLNLKRGI